MSIFTTWTYRTCIGYGPKRAYCRNRLRPGEIGRYCDDCDKQLLADEKANAMRALMAARERLEKSHDD